MTEVIIIDTHQSIKDIIVNCFQQEAEALLTVSQSIDESMIKVVQHIEACQGRVVVCGVGKSGLIGKKIAATLASTGTPAYFVHAAEAAHGDLGMILAQDVVLLLSNSGETAELIHLISGIRKIGATTIAITASQKSTLGTQADLVIAHGVFKEADHLNVAPTVSAVVLLAIGDALAVALSKRRHFKKSDFHRFHPGGALGKRLTEE